MKNYFPQAGRALCFSPLKECFDFSLLFAGIAVIADC
jgi:hypothetical protein